MHLEALLRVVISRCPWVLHAQGRKGDLLLYSVLKNGSPQAACFMLIAIAAWPRTATLLIMTQKM
jgi:hypothetical protein